MNKSYKADNLLDTYETMILLLFLLLLILI